VAACPLHDEILGAALAQVDSAEGAVVVIGPPAARGDAEEPDAGSQ
jgi:hypothetical protein